MDVLHVTSRQFAGESSRRLSVAGSYHRARTPRVAASAGSVFVWLLQASSNGPPVHRIGTHASEGREAEAVSAHDNKKSPARWMRGIGRVDEEIEAKTRATSSARSAHDLKRVRFLHAKA